jgi:hypothetical protein
MSSFYFFCSAIDRVASATTYSSFVNCFYIGFSSFAAIISKFFIALGLSALTLINRSISISKFASNYISLLYVYDLAIGAGKTLMARGLTALTFSLTIFSFFENNPNQPPFFFSALFGLAICLAATFFSACYTIDYVSPTSEYTVKLDSIKLSDYPRFSDSFSSSI